MRSTARLLIAALLGGAGVRTCEADIIERRLGGLAAPQRIASSR